MSERAFLPAGIRARTDVVVSATIIPQIIIPSAGLGTVSDLRRTMHKTREQNDANVKGANSL